MQKKVINLLQNSRKTKTEKKMTGEVRSYERKRGMYILYEKCVIIQEIKRNRKKNVCGNWTNDSGAAFEAKEKCEMKLLFIFFISFFLCYLPASRSCVLVTAKDNQYS